MPKQWIQKALNPEHRGILRKELGTSKFGRIPQNKLEEASEKSGAMGKRATLALTIQKMRKK